MNNGLKSRMDTKDNSKCITISLPTSTWSHCFVGVEASWGSVCFFFSDEGPTLETLDFAFYIGSTPTIFYFNMYLNKVPTLETLDFAFFIGSTPTFFYFNLYLNTGDAAHCVYFTRRERLIEMQIKRIFKLVAVMKGAYM